jgi:hypothetical protein
MKTLIPDKDLKPKSFEPGMSSYADFGIEFFKAKSTKFWDGMLIGLVIGYIPYAWHMYI